KRAYCLKTQPATGETYPKSDLFNKASANMKKTTRIKYLCGHGFLIRKIFIRRAISLPFIDNGG
ncbi:hypothetical protein ACTZQB_25640, partial [Klebsiella pneumoniae]